MKMTAQMYLPCVTPFLITSITLITSVLLFFYTKKIQENKKGGEALSPEKDYMTNG